MPRERLITPKSTSMIEESLNVNLRPERLSEYIGQESLKEKLNISIIATRGRKEPLEHILFHGPPGLGKTTLAHIIANEMGTKLITSSGPALTKTADLMGILTNLSEGDVLFIDEIHRLSTTVEEFIYPAMEDYKIDFVVDSGPYARTINIKLKRFTLVGATTRAGFLSAPFRNRFGLSFHLDFYEMEDLQEIILRSAVLLSVIIDEEASNEIAKRSRGTPRVANRLLRRVRDYAQVKANGNITAEIAREALQIEGIDNLGLDELDRKYLNVLIHHYNGGPAGIEAIAASLNEESETLEDIVEPFLLVTGLIQRTKNGRKASPKALTHLNIKDILGENRQKSMF